MICSIINFYKINAKHHAIFNEASSLLAFSAMHYHHYFDRYFETNFYQREKIKLA